MDGIVHVLDAGFLLRFGHVCKYDLVFFHVQFVEEGTTLYSSTYRFYKNQSIKKASGENPYYEVGNRGHFYEAYRYLYLSLGKDNSIQPSNQQLIEAFNRTLSGGGQAGSFSRGGDIGL